MENLEEQLFIIQNKVGLNKNGIPNGNGLIGKVRDIELYIEKNKFSSIELDIRIKNIEKSILDIQDSIKCIRDNLKDNITFRSFGVLKNVIIGFSAVTIALGSIGAFLFRILSYFYT